MWFLLWPISESLNSFPECLVLPTWDHLGIYLQWFLFCFLFIVSFVVIPGFTGSKQCNIPNFFQFDWPLCLGNSRKNMYHQVIWEENCAKLSAILELESECHSFETWGGSSVCFSDVLTLSIWKPSLFIIRVIMARDYSLRMFGNWNSIWQIWKEITYLKKKVWNHTPPQIIYYL